MKQFIIGIFKMKKPLFLIIFTLLTSVLTAQTTQVSDQKITKLIKELSDSDPVIRYYAAKSLAKYGKAAAPAISGLIRLLDDGTHLTAIKFDPSSTRDIFNQEVAFYTSPSLSAEDALAKIGEPSVKPLMKKLEYSNSWITMKIKRVLAKIGEPAVVPLLEFLHSPDKRKRIISLQPLGFIKDSRTIDPLLHALNDENKNVRSYVIRALGFKKDLIVINTLIDILLDKDDTQRVDAAKALSNIKNPLAIEPFIKTMKESKDWKLRRACVRGLKNWRSKEEVIDAFLFALQDNHSEIRNIGADALGRWKPANFAEKAIYCVAKADWDECVNIGAEAVKPLISVLTDTNSEVQIAAAEALGDIGDPSAVNPLIDILHDENRDVRRHVAQALGWIKDPRAVEPLLHLLNDENRWVRETVVTALGNMGQSALDFLIPASNDPDLNIRAGAVQAIGMIRSPQSFDVLKSSLNDEEAGIREKAVKGLVNLMDDPRSFDIFISILFDDKVEGDVAIVEALGEQRNPRAVEPLISVLKKHKDRKVRITAISSLGLIGDERAVKPLIKALKRRDLHGWAATALGKIDDPEAVNALVLTLRKNSITAAFALARLKDTRAVPVLIPVLGKPYQDDTRKRAAEALGELKDSRAVPALAKMLDGYDVLDFHNVATQALGKIGLPAAEPLIARMKHEKKVVRRSIVKALGKIDDPITTPPLLKALEDEDVRTTAVKALGEKRDPTAVPALIDMLQGNSSYIKDEAAGALGKIKDPRAIQPLIQALKGRSNVQQHAAEALAGMGKQAMEPLIASLTDPDFKIRAGVIKALGMIEDSSVVDVLLSALKDEAVPVRQNAIKGLEKYENERRVFAALEEVALHDTNRDVRRSVVRKVTNRDILAEIAENDPSELIRKMAQYGMLEQDALYKIFQTEVNYTLRKEALERITDDSLLVDIALNNEDSGITRPTVRRIRDQSCLMEVLNKSSDHIVLLEVTKNITDQSVLIDIARHGWKVYSSGRIRETAIKRLLDKTVLEDIAKHDRSKSIRMEAEKRLKELK